ncbi:MAG: hypothetical protein F6K11_23235 [Leptolyngbya sp. SIO3F4]|nr:hypothetical protein [Leptolyngbya sp. SIO3F4]
MKQKSYLLSSLFSVGLLVSTATVASAGVGKFQAIDQPLPLKLGITLAGIGLIALELWWFLAKRK